MDDAPRKRPRSHSAFCSACGLRRRPEVDRVRRDRVACRRTTNRAGSRRFTAPTPCTRTVDADVSSHGVSDPADAGRTVSRADTGVAHAMVSTRWLWNLLRTWAAQSAALLVESRRGSGNVTGVKRLRDACVSDGREVSPRSVVAVTTERWDDLDFEGRPRGRPQPQISDTPVQRGKDARLLSLNDLVERRGVGDDEDHGRGMRPLASSCSSVARSCSRSSTS